ncbi:ABC transporter [Candidatus Woesebacteria bacterium RIFCSPLOWO2_01_FULL_39_61]|uniref:ABC transporter-like protein, ABC-2 type transport system ATP-binding protein n=2 Tax=Microgenomates group TaxID=1794810 RepID=A0A0H4TQ70_9BACT|nr:ABC transporter-like protein, ABC-2 type transport system ATP-binding protein [uncultured Microgenomates bacterium Rifle_16ft_4_minimus_37836]OGM25144.1 MAG: ABC transporter [Candidatus Woesebacteria bacterium RIFCSPHIGHO2_01_FULL_39_95]OGM34024.1 MAG: ABC transporter [Candidatus Woesebacteria bacterium RIFCSPHIGHO2_02_FULL_39_13]OGM38282.1 MAG: ABC transporter [Candidatus Woesebacteria bacterium RIFCSPHIGHO2_12_FULL_40_20]OGM66988.1 MAG: ABC transporter [Candidatus Woesebacteria bacterium R
MSNNFKAEAEKTIIVERLVKNFELIEKKDGILNSFLSIVAPKKKSITALKDISFTIDQGELIGFIGPNGAGKTTTLKILSGLLYPTSGFTQVLGFTPWDRKPEFLKEISLVMGQKNQLWWDLPAIETLKLNQAIYELSDSVFRRNLNELTDLLEVGKLLNTQVRQLSLGQRMRLELIASLLHSPKVLFLDEPTLGLDVVAQQKVRDFIFDYNRRNKATIILTSHNMDDLIDLAKRVIVIDKGEILFDGNLQKLVEEFAKEKVIKLYFSKNTDIKKLEEIGKIKRINLPQVILAVPREVAAIAASEILQNFPVADLTVEEEPIEDVIRRVFKGEITRKEKRLLKPKASDE